MRDAAIGNVFGRTVLAGSALGWALCASAGCVVSQRCFAPGDCQEGQTCSAAGRCVARQLDSAVVPSTDSKVEIRCALPGMVKIEEAFCIDVYEASRPDATESSAGEDGRRATSRVGVLPWQVTSNAEAAQACAAAGKRLCTAPEWQLACQGPKRTVYGYGDAYEPKTCNGIDTFAEWEFHLEPTGHFASCESAYGVFDMNGNLWEHVAGGNERTIRGGAYNCSDSKTLHRCDYVPRTWSPTARGFRCCAEGVSIAGDAGPDDGGLSDGEEPDQECLEDPDGGPADGDAGVDGGPPADGARDQPPGDGAASDGAPQLDAVLLDGALLDGMLLDGPTACCPFPAMVPVFDLFCVDVYEASRPDATPTTFGTDNSMATSREGVLPWMVASNAEAELACTAAGKRLCSPLEWLIACRGPQQTAYAYGDVYDPVICNGLDTFPGWQFHLAVTGAFPGCTNGFGVYDMNGNVWEHVTGGDATTIRGGAYNCSNSELFHRCDYIPTTWTPTAQGFRCCAQAGPPQG